jgi:hypothetical protein
VSKALQPRQEVIRDDARGKREREQICRWQIRDSTGSPVNGQLLPQDAPQKIEWQERIGRGTTFISVDFLAIDPGFFRPFRFFLLPLMNFRPIKPLPKTSSPLGPAANEHRQNNCPGTAKRMQAIARVRWSR